jgi:hypothetical protein
MKASVLAQVSPGTLPQLGGKPLREHADARGVIALIRSDGGVDHLLDATANAAGRFGLARPDRLDDSQDQRRIDHADGKITDSPAGDRVALRGRLRVDLPTEVARTTIVPALPDFMATHPELELEVSSTVGKLIWFKRGLTAYCDLVLSGTRR